MKDLSFDLDDLELGDLAVTSMRDSVALPESGASGGPSSCSCSSGSCSSCVQPQLPSTNA